MSVSVVIPACNAAIHLRETIESVLVQTFTDWELVIVDDGSTDATYRVASRFARRDSRIRVVRQPNAGLSAARNSGYAVTDAASRHVVFLDSDDVWTQDALEVLVAALDARPEAAAANGRGLAVVDAARYLFALDDKAQPPAPSTTEEDA